mgnify:CR=1 FL=1
MPGEAAKRQFTYYNYIGCGPLSQCIDEPNHLDPVPFYMRISLILIKVTKSILDQAKGSSNSNQK